MDQTNSAAHFAAPGEAWETLPDSLSLFGPAISGIIRNHWDAFFGDDDSQQPIPYQIGKEWLSIPANCIVDIPPFLEVQKRTEEYHTIKFFWPSLSCLTRDRLADFRDPTTRDRVLTSGLGGYSSDFTWAFLIFIGSVDGISKYTYDEAAFELDYDSVLDMYVHHTLFIDQKIDLFVDHDHDLQSITRFLRCGEGDWYCTWHGQFCGLDAQIDFDRAQLPNAKAIYDDTERLFCETWRGEPG